MEKELQTCPVCGREKEPVPAETEGDGRNGFWWYVCGECHGHISEGDHYCRHCGRAVKWE